MHVKSTFVISVVKSFKESKMGMIVSFFTLIVLLFRAFVQLFVELFSVLLMLSLSIGIEHIILFGFTVFLFSKFKGE